ncbi:aldo/keto reductase [Bifidobacterium sp. SMB2]|uniref:Aldo/keto reductase n=1 Tax=Bifidobacterium saimiriisciurei TaxID=2661627 RepID=A0ABX0C8B0_9BIFI|nr:MULTISPECIES: aldo/keto reductase [Bifidobacterium]NEG95432.1 aldo/keto reductase [Bifidobacterium sp. SMB2]NEH11384.1 aldo/keto reductase [Bifidobacterium saimiriisciurei]
MMAQLAGYETPRLGMGTMALAIEGRPADRNVAIDTIHAALDAGVRYLDTAWSYYLPSKPGTGESEDLGYGEKLVYDALATWDGPKDDVLVATKTGWLRTLSVSSSWLPLSGGAVEHSETEGVPATSEADSTAQPKSAIADQTGAVSGNNFGEYGWQTDARPETIIRQAKESARRLHVDSLSLLYSHCNDPQLPYEDQMGAFRRLVDEGVVRHVGISRVDARDIDIARGILGDSLVAVQNQFSPSYPDPDHTLEYCAELGLAFVCWSPLGGFLDAVDQHKYDPFREVAAARGCSYQRVTLAWELAQYDRLFTIPSARNPHEIQDSFAATTLSLTASELDYLNAAVAR